MPGGDVRRRIEARLVRAETSLPSGVIDQLAAYLELLARWNRKINLTAFDLDVPSDAAIDRLVVEPVEAAALIRQSDRLALDIGSGGGSPALPLKIAAPALQMVLVEARARKSAFLREAVRTLGCRDVTVETLRFERDAVPAALIGTVDVVTVRAVAADDGVWSGIVRALSPDGQVVWFGKLVKTQKHANALVSEVIHLKSGAALTLLSMSV